MMRGFMHYLSTCSVNKVFKNKAGYTAVRCVPRVICSLVLAPSLITPSLFTPFPVPFHHFLSLPFTLRNPWWSR